MGALALTVVSIAFFNFAGVSITRELGATNRKVLDSLRTLVIWAFSLIIGWQLFYWLQVRKKVISQKETIYCFTIIIFSIKILIEFFSAGGIRYSSSWNVCL